MKRTMLEEVARAICGASRDPDICVREAEADWKAFIPEARAALQALREPTEEMNAAAKPFRKGLGETAERLFRAMIDAALQ